MKLSFVTPRLELAPYIDSFWIFQSDFGLPIDDSRIITPNGKAKIIIPFKNSLFMTHKNRTTEYKEGSVIFIGIWDEPTILSSSTQLTGTIGVEFKPGGAFPFFSIPMHELTNTIFHLNDLLGKDGAKLIEHIGNAKSTAEKVDILQVFLLGRLQQYHIEHTIAQVAINAVNTSHGLINIKDLAENVGYSNRYLNMLFQQHVGLPPKTIARILRFHKFYQQWAVTDSLQFVEDDIYDYYHDQSHFIKEFKQFTGYAPKKFTQINNELGRIFYKK